MLIEIPEIVKKYSNILSKGVVVQFAPGIAKGALIELLKARKVDYLKATEWVENNSSLWESLGAGYQETLTELVRQVGSPDWLTVDWAINAMREDLPAVASLFLGWKKANNWLKRQVKEIKEKVEG